MSIPQLWPPSIIQSVLIQYASSGETNQCLHGSLQGMLVVSSELRVGAFQGRVSGGLWLLDTIGTHTLATVRRNMPSICAVDRSRSWIVKIVVSWWCIPVTVSLLRLIMLGRVLGF